MLKPGTVAQQCVLYILIKGVQQNTVEDNQLYHSTLIYSRNKTS